MSPKDRGNPFTHRLHSVRGPEGPRRASDVSVTPHSSQWNTKLGAGRFELAPTSEADACTNFGSTGVDAPVLLSVGGADLRCGTGWFRVGCVGGPDGGAGEGWYAEKISGGE